MAKTLIVLSDGTGNSAAKLFKTNVWKLYQALDLTPSSDQIALYDDGVGTSRFTPWALLTGAFGFGLKRNVIKMYVFLSRHFHNETNVQGTLAEGKRQPPQLYAFGFSRGAFTIRVVAGFVLRQGLVPLASEAEMCRMAVLSYRQYRKQCFHTKFGIEKPFRALRDTVVRCIDRAKGRPDYRTSQNTTDGVRFRFLGVWDTVAAYGMPVEELRYALDKLIFPLRFASSNLLEKVDCARHALSIDDERSSFAPLLWDHENGDRLQQFWFAGMHANVGCGYPDDSQSSLPLVWIAAEAAGLGLRMRANALDDMRARATPFGKVYDSRSGLGSFYRYQPRTIRCDVKKGDIPIVHESVVFRMATGFEGYAPVALPDAVRVVDKTGTVHQFGGFMNAAAHGLGRFGGFASVEAPDEGAKLATMVAALKPPGADQVKLVRAAELRRRIAYFSTLIPSLILLAFPIVGRMLPAPTPDFITADWQGPLGDLNAIASSLAPSYVKPWLEAFANNPTTAAILAIVGLVSWWRGRALRATIAERSRVAWNVGNAKLPANPSPSLLDALALRLLASKAAKASWHFAAWRLFPFVALLAAALLAIATLDRTAFWFQSSRGGICQTQSDLGKLVLAQEESFDFNTSDPCMDTGLRLSRDHRYEISIAIPDTAAWSDGGNEADLTGVGLAKLGWLQRLTMASTVPVRRHLKAAWFVPIARVGTYGTDEHVLVPSDVDGTAKPRKLMTSVLAPHNSGELFLFVNDAYWGLFPLHLYANNAGKAKVKVRRLTNPGR